MQSDKSLYNDVMKKSFASLLHFMECKFSLSKKQVLFAILVLLIIGLGLRCGYWMMRDHPPRDEQLYIQNVEGIIKNDDSRKKDYTFGPLMPMLAANVARFGLEPETALRSLNVAYSILWLLMMFLLCYEVFSSSTAGLLGMMLAVFNPYSIRMSCQILREPLYLLIFTTGLWLAVRFIKNQSLNPLYPLLLAGLTMLGFFTRYEGIEISLFLPLAIIVIFMQCKWQRVRMCFYSLAIYIVSFGLLIGALINSDNNYIRDTNQRVIGYFRLFTGNGLK